MSAESRMGHGAEVEVDPGKGPEQCGHQPWFLILKTFFSKSFPGCGVKAVGGQGEERERGGALSVSFSLG